MAAARRATILYKDYTDEDMRVVRFKEQKKAAVVGEYAAQVLLDYPSKAIKDGSNKQAVEDIAKLLKATRPQIVYTHNLADKHDTHVGVALKVIEAVRHLPKDEQPQQLYGCEVWRDLDWMMDADKVPFDCSAHENLQMALVACSIRRFAAANATIWPPWAGARRTPPTSPRMAPT